MAYASYQISVQQFCVALSLTCFASYSLDIISKPFDALSTFDALIAFLFSLGSIPSAI